MLGVCLLGISMVNEIVPLPRQVQRGLAFLPGNWDTQMARDAAASNDFRWRVWTLWTQKFFPQHPLIGRGFGFKSEWVKQDTDLGRAEDYEQMVETGNIHNGFLATLDAVGILGAIFFIAWNIRLLGICLRVGFKIDDETGFVRRFLALYLGVTILSYWIGAATMGSFLPGEFALAAVLLRLQSSRIPRLDANQLDAPVLDELPAQRRVNA
jgi:O-antigen ligase